MTREEKQKAIDILKISAPVMAVTQEEFNDYIQILNKVMDWLEAEPCDAVSREEAIATADFTDCPNIPLEICKQITDEVVKRLKLLPPVTPKPTECEDAVSREFMYKLGAKCIAVRNENGELVAIASIESLPPVTPKQRTGHWVEIGDEPYDTWECDNCGFVIDGSGCVDPEEYRDIYKFCPNCGAKMERNEG